MPVIWKNSKPQAKLIIKGGKHKPHKTRNERVIAIEIKEFLKTRNHFAKLYVNKSENLRIVTTSQENTIYQNWHL